MRPLSRRPLRFATPPVRNPSGSQANHLPLTGEAMTIPLAGEPRAVACGAVLFASPAKGRWGRRAAHGSVGSRFFRNPSGSEPLSQRPLSRRSRQLPLAGEPMAVYLAGEAMAQSMRLFTAASIYSHTPRKFLFTSLFGMRRTVKP